MNNLLNIQTLENNNAPKSAVAITEFLSQDGNQIYNAIIGLSGIIFSVYGMITVL